jgi:2-polyprenyl-3-methyl-5-hydroxy-6-metoxy-1,4-benzoquinol methylase
MMQNGELIRQDSLTWERADYDWYGILGHFQVLSVLEVGQLPALLDIGCGDGLLTVEFCKHFSRVVGVDASAAHIDKARIRCAEARFFVSLIEDLSLDERFDTVVMLNLLEHVVDPVQVLQSAAKHLKFGGCVIAQVPNALAINRWVGRLMGVISSEYELSKWDIEVAGHRRYYDMKGLVADFEKAGFTVTATGGIFFKIFSTPQMKWFLQNGLWDSGNFGWSGTDRSKDWRWEFCRACYEVGKDRPEDCNIIYAIGTRPKA